MRHRLVGSLLLLCRAARTKRLLTVIHALSLHLFLAFSGFSSDIPLLVGMRSIDDLSGAPCDLVRS
jgi:hypothetical protein